MKERAALSDRLRSFGPVTNREAVAKYLSDGRGLVARKRGLKVATLVGRRGYVPLAFRWRCGSEMTLSHSTQRTMPAWRSFFEAQLEIMRLCIQARGGCVGEIVVLVLIVRDSWCTSREAESNGYHCLCVPAINHVLHDSPIQSETARC